MIRYLEEFLILFLKSTHIDWLSGLRMWSFFLEKVAITEHNTYNKSFHFVKSTRQSYSNMLYGGKTIFRLSKNCFLTINLQNLNTNTNDPLYFQGPRALGKALKICLKWWCKSVTFIRSSMANLIRNMWFMKEKKNHDSLETTCCCIPYCVHRELITEKNNNLCMSRYRSLY